MILGTGVDLVALPALAGQVGLPGSTFLDSVLTARERRAVGARVRAEGGAPGDPGALAPHVGARWAAKEAFVKAWSAALGGSPPPIAPDALDWREIEVVQDHWGRPSLHLHGRVAREVARTVGGADQGVRVHLSLSHDGDLAAAVVLLERVDAPVGGLVGGPGADVADSPGADSPGADVTADVLARQLTGAARTRTDPATPAGQA